MTSPQAEDWPGQVVEKLDGVVAIARDRLVVPIATIARAIVFGILAAFMAVVIAVLIAITTVRVLDIVIPGAVWSAHAITGGLFLVIGLFLWWKRKPKNAND